MNLDSLIKEENIAEEAKTKAETEGKYEKIIEE